MVATLNQPQYAPWPVEEQVVAIFAGVNGYLDPVPVADVPRFQEDLRDHLRADQTMYAQIREEKQLSEELQERLHAEIKKVANAFGAQQAA
jgi:F-type H+-transporting ATPase subunit alpha